MLLVIQYMQRGGAWDNSDVKGAQKKRWLQSDKEYAAGGFKKEQSVSIFGKGEGLDWTGTRSRRGPEGTIPGAAPKFPSNYKAPNVNQIKGAKVNGAQKKNGKVVEDETPKKSFFGLF